MGTNFDIGDVMNMQKKAYLDAVEMLFATLNKRIDEQNITINQLQRSLEFSQDELKQVKDEHNNNTIELSNLKIKNEQLESTIIKLTGQITYQEDYSRRNNLRFEGITESAPENWEQTQFKIKKLLDEKFDMPNVQIERAHRLKKLPDQNVATPRTIVARFSSFDDREKVLRNAKVLKSTNIFVNEDLSEATAKSRKEKIPLLQAARRNGKIAYFIRDKFVIKERKMENAVSTSPLQNVSSLVNVFTPKNLTSELPKSSMKATENVITSDSQDVQLSMPDGSAMQSPTPPRSMETQNGENEKHPPPETTYSFRPRENQ